MSMRFVLLGNVDNGKSTLGGTILINSENISEVEVHKAKTEAEKNGKGTFWLAYLLDIDDTERERGITLGYTTFDFKYKNKDFKMIDVPGHKDLVHEMVIGASYANVALLVLSARRGEYESAIKGQAIEHVLISRGLGISTLIIAVNKMDESNESEFERIKKDFNSKIKKFKFKNIIYVPISAYYGTNIKQLLDTLIECNPEEPKDKQITIKEKLANTKLLFDNIPILITLGFKCIAHSKTECFNIEFVDINNDNCKFVTQKNSIDKNGMPKLIDVKIKITDNINSTQISSNLVIRYNNQTIGLARVFE